MRRWHTGCAVLSGDAAWCAAPLAGIGATLPVTGGDMLASAIARGDTLDAAFVAYATAMRPIFGSSRACRRSAHA
ncbi:oxidoreductase [Xanthomonas bromi]|uniref:Oxidoreductase n=1 Tax=Xanthomonas bromi TaxID=56449 RepID=A0A1C3NI02_9XANT|nr:oxidoreductase [Xanthomonas bromi]